MKIGVISDTHDHLENVDKAFALLEKHGVEMIVHCGDWVAPYSVEHISKKALALGVALKGVLGNNDGEVFQIISNRDHAWELEMGKETLELDVDKRNIAVYHGTDKTITDSLEKSDTYDAVFSGHTHVPRSEMVEGTLALNPGTLSGFSAPRGGSIDIGELAVYDTTANTTEFITFPL